MLFVSNLQREAIRPFQPCGTDVTWIISGLKRRQGFTTSQHETTLADVLHLVGEDNIIWGSDYPYPDGIWPDSMKAIEEDLGGLDADVQRKLTCENAGKLYGFI